MVTRLPIFDILYSACEGCLIGKQHRNSFLVGRSKRAKQPVELMHRVRSLGHNKYILTFIDDCIRKTWIYLLKQKSKAFNKFKEFKVLVERQSDRGREFTSNEFYNYCKSYGIQRQLIASYAPKQNGITERKNKTIVEMARSMLNAKSLPKTFWAEVIACAVFLLNRCPTKAILGRTPEEAWSGYKPEVSFLIFFGCIAYSHITKEHIKKFDDKSDKCIFIGYSDLTKGYRLYNPETRKLIMSRDVQFLKNETWTWTQTQSEEKRVVLEEDFEIQKDSTTNISTPNTPPIISSPMQTETEQESKSQGRPKRSYIMPAYLKDYEVMKDFEIIDQGLVNFCLFAYCDSISYEEVTSEEKWI